MPTDEKEPLLPAGKEEAPPKGGSSTKVGVAPVPAAAPVAPPRKPPPIPPRKRESQLSMVLAKGDSVDKDKEGLSTNTSSACSTPTGATPPRRAAGIVQGESVEEKSNKDADATKVKEDMSSRSADEKKDSDEKKIEDGGKVGKESDKGGKDGKDLGGFGENGANQESSSKSVSVSSPEQKDGEGNATNIVKEDERKRTVLEEEQEKGKSGLGNGEEKKTEREDENGKREEEEVSEEATARGEKIKVPSEIDADRVNKCSNEKGEEEKEKPNGKGSPEKKQNGETICGSEKQSPEKPSTPTSKTQQESPQLPKSPSIGSLKNGAKASLAQSAKDADEESESEDEDSSPESSDTESGEDTDDDDHGDDESNKPLISRRPDGSESEAAPLVEKPLNNLTKADRNKQNNFKNLPLSSSAAVAADLTNGAVRQSPIGAVAEDIAQILAAAAQDESSKAQARDAHDSNGSVTVHLGPDVNSDKTTQTTENEYLVLAGTSNLFFWMDKVGGICFDIDIIMTFNSLT